MIRSQIETVLYLLKNAIKDGVQYNYLHFFQGSDLPIKKQNEIHSFFDSVNGQEFISVEKDRSTMVLNKCWYRHFFCHKRFYRKNKFMKALNFFFVYVQKILHIRHNIDIDLYQGSALFFITRDLAKYLLEKEPEIQNRFCWSLAADECFIQSVVMSSPNKGCNTRH
ncbi:beta-1,6-N-acetylglucosaminyltransferase [Parabacteroides johnsonii]|uniref:beta-1,6-N-acetylglucosaminyltransferase n=1 Tax=Parabacteroides johnsonii TaxID=387661 RepID=UPI003AB8E054